MVVVPAPPVEDDRQVAIFLLDQRPMSGKMKDSARILARAFEEGAGVRERTARREEKVRILRALGPVRVSAAWAARGWRRAWDRFVERVSIGVEGEVVEATLRLGAMELVDEGAGRPA